MMNDHDMISDRSLEGGMLHIYCQWVAHVWPDVNEGAGSSFLEAFGVCGEWLACMRWQDSNKGII